MLKALPLLLLLLGCGYHFVGEPRLPGGIKSLAVADLQNTSREPELPRLLKEALRAEFISRGVRVLPPGKAEGLLEGRVLKVSFRSVAYDEKARARQYRVSVKLDLSLTKGGEVLWRRDGIVLEETYSVRGDVIMDDEAKDQAFDQLAEDLAEAIYLELATEGSLSTSTFQKK